MNITLTILDDNQEELVVSLPAKYQVCLKCQGHGRHTNPSVDGHGITEEEWCYEWDEESREMYLSGGYDVTCYQCQGDRVMLVVDVDHINQYGSELEKQALQIHYQNLRDERDYQNMVASEIAYGC